MWHWLDTQDNYLEDKDPDQTIDFLLKEVTGFINEKHGRSLTTSRYFNMQRLSWLIGSQFVKARKNGFVIEDCEMCSCFDREICYCSHYHQVLRLEQNPFYYHKALCPALVIK